MNDQRLEEMLRRVHAGRTTAGDAETIRQAVATIPIERIAQRRRWLPHGQHRGTSMMLTATKLAAATAIVALVAGFLIVGVLRTPEDEIGVPGVSAPTAQATADASMPAASPTLDSTTLDGLDLVEVEPGIVRVISDGVRVLRRPAISECGSQLRGGRVTVGQGGSVWLSWPDAFIELGVPGEHGWAEGQSRTGPYGAADLEADRRGTLWRSWRGPIDVTDEDLERRAEYDAFVTEGYPRGCPLLTRTDDGALRAYDGTSWQVEASADDTPITEIEVVGDTRWIGWTEGAIGGKGRGSATVARAAGDGAWQVIHERPTAGDDESLTGLDADEEDLYLTITVGDVDPEAELWHLDVDPVDLTTWTRIEHPFRYLDHVAAAPDGGLWAWVEQREVARFDGERWTAHPADVDDSGLQQWATPATWAVDPEGAVWLGAFDKRQDAPDGLLRFDGVAWTHYLPGHDVRSLDVAPDGSVWVWASSEPLDSGPADSRSEEYDLYVISHG